MTPAERSLLLAVAKSAAVLNYSGHLRDLIEAVEAEAADSRPLGEPCQSCTGHIRENNPIRCAECSPTAHQNYERSLRQDTTCPTCNGRGFGLPSGPKQDTTCPDCKGLGYCELNPVRGETYDACPACNGTGKKEKTDDHS